jgi:dihydroorotate dehydrogenase (NAD+) catalytic subunit
MKRKRSVVTNRGGPGRRTAAGQPSLPYPLPASGRTAGPGADSARGRSSERPKADGPATAAAPRPRSPSAVDLATDLAPRSVRGLALRNPVLIGAGGASYGIELADAHDLGRIGAFVTRGTTLQARSGHPPPRMAEVPGGLLNAVGLPNPGIESVLDRHASRWAAWQAPVIVNVCADTPAGFAALATRLDGESGVAGIELNLSCPDARDGGRPFALDGDAVADVVAAVRSATDLPVVAKLSAAAPDVRDVATAAEEAGADALCAINTLAGLALDRARRGALLGATYGGLSGPLLKPVALRVVYEIAQVVRVPIIGAGGITTLDDVLDMLAAGASAVQVVTAALDDPALPARLADELAAWCAEQGLATHRSLVGAALPSRRDRSGSRGAEYRLRR